MINFSKLEEKILAFWDQDQTFQKSLAKKSPKGNFVFFEGPPTANGRPGIHHVLARIFKDIIPRYKTMQGYLVERKAGWDTQGLPVELEVERAIGVAGKPDIEKYGVAKFNEKCKESVWKYKKEWEEMTRRIGFWLDMDHPYITYEKEYIETLWWIFKQAWQKNLVYQAYKVVPYCPRCGTALSSHEVAQGYKNIKEESVYLKLKVKGQDNTYLLAWTTTPWTLPSNLVVAAGERIEYVKAKSGNDYYILAKNLVDKVLAAHGHGYEIIEEFKGDKVVGLEYEPMYYIYSDPSYFKVYAADFVSIEDGTGMVHIAPHYGEDDYNLFITHKLPIPELLTLDLQGKLIVDVPGKGKFAKDADKDIMADLKQRGILFGVESYAHDYPFCWRCDSPLLYYSRKSWFIKMSALQQDLLKNAEQINWIPAHIKEGRFGEWLGGIKDWAISRERYWGTPIPIWVCQGCQYRECLGSYQELLEKSGKSLPENFNPHKPFVDEYAWKCPECGQSMKRVPEVMDCWFDSGAMPFAQWHYPFENKERIEKSISYPAEYISEAIDQTRGWFYTLLGISTMLDKGTSYKNVICLGHILDNKGQKMSKHVGNVVEPMTVIDQYGVDALRWYFYTVNQPGESKLFDTEGVRKVVQRVLLTLWNCLQFYELSPTNYESITNILITNKINILDKWLVAKFNLLVKNVTEKLDKYDITTAGRDVENFITELSQWYIRRSRERLKNNAEEGHVLGYVLLNLSKLLAPFTPFISDEIYQQLTGKNESVHLADWPVADESVIDKKIIEQMKSVVEICTMAHSLRSASGLKVRQPLAKLEIVKPHSLSKELLEIIQEEVNVKVVCVVEKPSSGEGWVNAENKVNLYTIISPELKAEGQARELVRQINSFRKEAKLTIKDKIDLYYQTDSVELKSILEKLADKIKTDTLSNDLVAGQPKEIKFTKEAEIDEAKIKLFI